MLKGTVRPLIIPKRTGNFGDNKEQQLADPTWSDGRLSPVHTTVRYGVPVHLIARGNDGSAVVDVHAV
jgi:hypothetical protein